MGRTKADIKAQILRNSQQRATRPVRRPYKCLRMNAANTGIWGQSNRQATGSTTVQAASSTPSTNVIVTNRTTASTSASSGTSAAHSAPRGGKRSKPAQSTEHNNVQENQPQITTSPALNESKDYQSLSPQSKRFKISSPVQSNQSTAATITAASVTAKASVSRDTQSQFFSSADKGDQIHPIKIIHNFFDFQIEDSREDFEWLKAQLAENGESSMAVNSKMITNQLEGMTNAKHVQQWFATLLVLKMTKRISGSEYANAKHRLLVFVSTESRSVPQAALHNHFTTKNLYEAFYFVVTKLVDLAQEWKAEYVLVSRSNCKDTPLERIRGMWDSCWTELVQFTTEIIGRMPKNPRASDNSVSFSTLFLFTIFVSKFWYENLLFSNDIVPVERLNSNEQAQSELNDQFDPSVSAVTKLATFLLQCPVYSDTDEAIPEIARLLYRLVIYKKDGKLMLTSGQALDLVQQLVVVVPSADKIVHFLPHLFYLGYGVLRYHLLFDNGAKKQLGRFERLDSMVIGTWEQVYRMIQVPLIVPGSNNNNMSIQAQWHTLASTDAIDAIIRLFSAVFAKYIANSERVETRESNEFDQMLNYFGAICGPEQSQALSSLCSIRQIISEAVSSP